MNITTSDPYVYADEVQGVLPSVLGRAAMIGLPTAMVSAQAAPYAIQRLFRAEDMDRFNVPTPDHGGRPDTPPNASEWALLQFAAALNCDLLSYAEEKDGEYIHQVIPIQGKHESKSNEGSLVFEAHCEAPHVPYPPDMVALLCLRNEEQGATVLWEVDDIVAAMGDRLTKVLMKPVYKFATGESWSDGREYIYPIITKNNLGQYMIRVDLTAVSATSRESKEALEILRAYCVDPETQQLKNQTDVVLQPGEVLLFDNRRCAHGRGGFPPNKVPAANRRWFQRVYLRRRTEHTHLQMQVDQLENNTHG